MSSDRPGSSAAQANGGSGHNPTNFSLVLGGPLYQLLRRTRLTDDALMLQRRRIIFISLFVWLPLLVLSALGGRLLGEGVAVPFLLDADLHVKFLVALPLLIGAELVVHQRIPAFAADHDTAGPTAQKNAGTGLLILPLDCAVNRSIFHMRRPVNYKRIPTFTDVCPRGFP